MRRCPVGDAEIAGLDTAGLDILGPVWKDWTMTDDLRTGVIWLVIDLVGK